MEDGFRKHDDPKEKKMTHEDAGHYAAKHPAGTQPDPRIAEAVKREVSDGKITCSAAFKISRDLNAPPARVGTVIDLLSPNREMSARAVRLSPDVANRKTRGKRFTSIGRKYQRFTGGQPVAVCFELEIAKKLGLAKMDVSSACETLGIKISSCQLGSFR